MKKYKGFISIKKVEALENRNRRKKKNLFFILIGVNLILFPITVQNSLLKKRSNKLEDNVVPMYNAGKKEDLIRWVGLWDEFEIQGRVKDGKGAITINEEDLERFREKSREEIKEIKVIEEKIEIKIK